jgi:hypothetical protein
MQNLEHAIAFREEPAAEKTRRRSESRERFSSPWLLAIPLFLGWAMLVAPTTAAAEQAWVRGEIKLNVRSGPGTQFRILGGIATGDGLTVLDRGDGWTKVRMQDGNAGWIPVGYLKPEPPPTVRLGQLEGEVVTLRDQLDSITEERGSLRTANATLSESDGAQRAEIERLILDNTKLRAGARYPELIAGACILAAGMIIGAMLHKSTTNKRPTSRIRM